MKKKILFIVLLLALAAGGYLLFMERLTPRLAASIESGTKIPDWIDVQLVSRGNPSRTGKRLEGPADIVVHYVGNPGTTAQQNRNYYNNRNSDVSSHFLVGLDGEIILCIPLNERSAATGSRNTDTISIEVCHPDATGQFTEAGYASLVRLTAWLMQLENLDADHVIRHYDVTGKLCPLWFVEHPEAFDKFRSDAAAAKAALQ